MMRYALDRGAGLVLETGMHWLPIHRCRARGEKDGGCCSDPTPDMIQPKPSGLPAQAGSASGACTCCLVYPDLNASGGAAKATDGVDLL